MRLVKQIKICVLLVVMIFLFRENSLATHNNNNECLGIYGSIQATGWDNASPITISCDGTPPERSPERKCPGESQRVNPGESFDLGLCSCPPYADGCLQINGVHSTGQVLNNIPGIPEDCEVTDIPDVGYCGSNGQTIHHVISITCPTKPVEPKLINCFDIIQPDTEDTCKSGLTKDETGKCVNSLCPDRSDCECPQQPLIPACGQSCGEPRDCTNIKDPITGKDCTACLSNPNGLGNTCQVPKACNDTCVKPEDCANVRDTAGNSCSECIPDSTGQLRCQVPPSAPVPACGKACELPRDCIGIKDPVSGKDCNVCLQNPNGLGNTCQVPKACNDTCVKPEDCANVKDTSGNDCTACIPDVANQLKCQVPPSVPAPACNTECTTNQQCATAKDGCVVCTENKCQLPPEETPPGENPPEETPPGENPPSETPPGENPPEETPPGENPPQNPPVTPTITIQPPGTNPPGTNPPGTNPPGTNPPGTNPPGTNPPGEAESAQCLCDGVAPGAIVLGKEVNFKAYAKTIGEGKEMKPVKSMDFYLGKVDPKNPNIVTAFKEAKAIAAKPSFGSSETEDKYEATWTFKFPENIDPKATYRIWATKIKCPKVQASLNTQDIILAQTAKSNNIFSQIITFITSIFGGSKGETVLNQTANTSSKPKDGIQIESFPPAKVVATDRCTYVNIRFSGTSY